MIMKDDKSIFQDGADSIKTITQIVSFIDPKKEVEKLQIKNAKNIIKPFFKKNTKIYIYDLSKKLDMDPKIVKKAVDELIEEGFLRQS